MNQTILDELTRRMPHLSGATLRIEPIERGGSDREFFRVEGTGTHPLILIRYGEGKEENRHYVDLARFLDSMGIHVPRILFHDPVDRLIGMEDLGERDLWSYRDEDWDLLRPLYEATLRQAVLLHSIRDPIAIGQLTLQKEFDAQLYRWEQRYFSEQCAQRVFGIEPDGDDPQLDRLATELAGMPRTLIHRDFQSQNVLICGGETHLIDFQGLRWGLPHYDVASLLFDPYAALPGDRREFLADYYESIARQAGIPIEGDYSRTLRHCAVQRLMQALGAYGFLGLEKGRTRFLSHIPTALRSLREVLADCPELSRLAHTLSRFPEALPHDASCACAS